MQGEETRVSTERLATLEADQRNLAGSMAKMADSQHQMAVTLAKLSTQQEEIARIQSRQASYDHRLTVAEGEIKSLVQQTAPLAGISERLAKNTFITGLTTWLSGAVLMTMLSTIGFIAVKKFGG